MQRTRARLRWVDINRSSIEWATPKLANPIARRIPLNVKNLYTSMAYGVRLPCGATELRHLPNNILKEFLAK